MSNVLRFCLFGVLALSVCLLCSSVALRADDDDDDKEDIAKAKKLADPLKKLIEAVESGKADAIDKAVKDIDSKDVGGGKGDLKHIMWAGFKTREKGGQGVGPKAGAITPDGVEAKIISMSKKPMPTAQLNKESADLLRLAIVSKAIADVATEHTPKKDDGKKKVADWKKYNQLQKDAAQDLENAIKAKDPDKVLDSVKNLYSSCTNCHATFRD
jgi:cytochrome c556